MVRGLLSSSLAILVAGCGFSGAAGDGPTGFDAAFDAAVDAPTEPADSSGSPDGASEPDAPVIPPDAQACFGTAVQVCLTTLPATGVTINATEILDTDSSPRCVPSNRDDLCVVAGTTVTVTGAGTRVRGRGSKPLVLLATQGEVTIAAGAAVEAYSSNFSDGGVVVGPGANPAVCVRTTIDGTHVGTSGGGGAGGSFGGVGGDGSNGDINGGPEGGQGGDAAAAISGVPPLRGGCPGGNGGRPMGAQTSAGGHGGGAVALIASTRVRIDGRIDASGGGGFGSAPASDGGGGGGSGGMIYLEGTMSTVLGASAAIYANAGAGAGGAGSGSSSGGAGGESTGPAIQAIGAFSTNGDAAPGGNGAFGEILNGAAPADAEGSDGGGGGGGGAGVVVIIPAITTNLGQVSPAPRVAP